MEAAASSDDSQSLFTPESDNRGQRIQVGEIACDRNRKQNLDCQAEYFKDQFSLPSDSLVIPMAKNANPLEVSF